MNPLQLEAMAKNAKQSSYAVAQASSEQKNNALKKLVTLIRTSEPEIFDANSKDIEAAVEKNLNEAFIDRLSLKGRLAGIIDDLENVISLDDPIGRHFDKKHINSIDIEKVTVPIGVLGVIYESRPNVTIDVASLAIKSGNAAILRGGSEILHTSNVFIDLVSKALDHAGLPQDAIQLINSTDRGDIKSLLKLNKWIDLIIPRGGRALHEFCRENSTIAVITGGIGICHLFVDSSADLEKSIDVIINAKTQRPSVCNALDTLLVHRDVAKQFIPKAIEKLGKFNVSFRLSSKAWDLIDENSKLSCQKASDSDWDQEWMALILGIKVVENFEEAIEHIHKHSSGHSDAILTENQNNAEQFICEIDSAAVYVNASTRFTDGSQLGLGAEIAISTQKLHARGPMALNELTSYKWVIHGNYTIRK